MDSSVTLIKPNRSRKGGTFFLDFFEFLNP